MSVGIDVRSDLSRVRNIALLVGIGGGVACYFVAKSDPDRFFPAYLVAYLFWTGISLGSLAISMLHHVTGGGWGIPIRRTVESAASVLLLMGALILPITHEMGHLYSWTDAAFVAADEILQRKAHYLNKESFFVRSAIYFGVWIVLSLMLNFGTKVHDSTVQLQIVWSPGNEKRATTMGTHDFPLQVRRRRGLAVLSGIGLILWGLSVTFAAVDWAMSLEPHWFSSMYGVMFMAGQAVSALATAIVVGVWLGNGLPGLKERSSAEAVEPPGQARWREGIEAPRQAWPEDSQATSRLHDLGNLLLAMVMFWSYVSFMQFLIIWSANLPEETPWYLTRSQGGWQFVVMLLAGLHFLVPILLLLMRQTKRNAPRLMRLAFLLLFMRLVDLSWLVLPTFTPNLSLQPQVVSTEHEHAGDEHGERISNGTDLWPLLITVPTVGGCWLAFFTWRLSVRSRIPVYDPSSVQEHRDELAGHAIT
jgi:hypothetical protein